MKSKTKNKTTTTTKNKTKKTKQTNKKSPQNQTKPNQTKTKQSTSQRQLDDRMQQRNYAYNPSLPRSSSNNKRYNVIVGAVLNVFLLLFRSNVNVQSVAQKVYCISATDALPLQWYAITRERNKYKKSKNEGELCTICLVLLKYKPFLSDFVEVHNVSDLLKCTMCLIC